MKTRSICLCRANSAYPADWILLCWPRFCWAVCSATTSIVLKSGVLLPWGKWSSPVVRIPNCYPWHLALCRRRKQTNRILLIVGLPRWFSSLWDRACWSTRSANCIECAFQPGDDRCLWSIGRSYKIITQSLVFWGEVLVVTCFYINTSGATASLYSLDFKNVSMKVSKGTFSIILPLSSPTSLRFMSSVVLVNESPDESLCGVLPTWTMRAFSVQYLRHLVRSKKMPSKLTERASFKRELD